MKLCPFCAEEIQDAAIVSKHCGRDLPRASTAPGPPPEALEKGASPFPWRSIPVAVLAVLVLLIAISSIAPDVIDSPAMRRARQLDTIDRARRGGSEPFMVREIPSMAAFLKIENGMTYREVVGVIGRAGELSVSSDAGGAIYTWKRVRCCANMSVHFRDDRVISKSQAGLE